MRRVFWRRRVGSRRSQSNRRGRQFRTSSATSTTTCIWEKFWQQTTTTALNCILLAASQRFWKRQQVCQRCSATSSCNNGRLVVWSASHQRRLSNKVIKAAQFNRIRKNDQPLRSSRWTAAKTAALHTNFHGPRLHGFVYSAC